MGRVQRLPPLRLPSTQKTYLPPYQPAAAARHRPDLPRDLAGEIVPLPPENQAAVWFGVDQVHFEGGEPSQIVGGGHRPPRPGPGSALGPPGDRLEPLVEQPGLGEGSPDEGG